MVTNTTTDQKGFRFRLISDVHLEFALDPMNQIKNILPEKEDDKEVFLFVCGDLYNHGSTGETGFIALEEWSKRFKYVIYIAGNHEYYGGTYQHINERIAYEIKHIKNVIFLNNNSFTIDNVSIFGSTFWTPITTNPVDAYTITRLLNDFLHIRYSFEDQDGIEMWKENITPAIVTGLFYQAVSEYTDWIMASKAKINIVLSHHAPSIMSAKKFYREATDRETLLLNQCYSFDAETILPMLDKVNLWCHGHMHNNADYYMGKTRVLANPYGYVGYELNNEFNSILSGHGQCNNIEIY